MKNYITIISVLFLLLILAIVGNLTISTLGLFFDYDVVYTGLNSDQSTSLNIKFIFLLKAIALLTFIVGVYVLISKLRFLVQRDFFNSKLILSFSRSGKLFLISGIIGFITSLFEILNITILKDYTNLFYLNIDSKSLYIMLMILGLFLILFSKVLDKGNILQQENDLTI